jgi:peptidoglycan/LPS O-acetylase OafA/YrhL
MFAVGALLAISYKQPVRPQPIFGALLVAAGPIIWFISCFLFHPKPLAGTETARSGLQLIAGYGLVALGCAALLRGFCLLGSRYMPGPLVRLGRISYGLYVYHVLVTEITIPIFHPGSRLASLAIACAASLAGTICVASISYAYLEAPFLRWKRRFEILHTRPI